QLDDRYFRGLEGQYTFDLHFLLQEEGAPAGEHIVRARGAWFGNRSVSAEVDLPAGRYEVVPKIAALKSPAKPEVQDVVREWAGRNPQKLRQVGMNYDVANAKGAEAETKTKKHKKKATSTAPKSSGAADYPSPPEVGADQDGAPSVEEADAAPQPAANPPPTEEKINPWNAICVIGLRVYTKDQDVSIKLVKPKDDEEAAALDVDGATAAGATM
ncbi:hypothetical protein AOQ84DRAFT_295289, partial [Glonium stellatum]